MWYIKHKMFSETYYYIYYDIDDEDYVCYDVDLKDWAGKYYSQEAAQKDIDNLGEVGVFLVPVFEQEGD